MALDGEGTSGDARRKRQEALRALAEGAPLAPTPETHAPSASEAPPLRRAPSRWPRWALALVSAVALLAVVAVVIAHLLPAPAPKARPIPAKLALDPETYGIGCLQNAAWSPDSREIAILGQQQNCGIPFPQSYAYYPTILAIVDATTSRSLGRLTPDGTIQRDLHLHAPRYITPENGPADSGDLTQQGALYRALVWSPDGKTIALVFDVTYLTRPPVSANDNGGTIDDRGIYLAAADGSSARAFAVNALTTPRFVDEWNVKIGKPVLAATAPVFSAEQFNSTQLDPPSLAYSWGPDGSLVGSGALTAAHAPAAPPPGPVGDPDGSASFTIWQPLGISTYAGDPEHPQKIPAFIMQSGFTAWSPDGTYLLNAYYQWRVQPSKQPTPSAAQLKVEGAAKMPLLPIRDAAMDAMLRPIGGKPDAYTSGSFAWSPNGKWLAAHLNTNSDGADTYAILDCATAKTLATITVAGASNANGNIQSGPGMMWAPDGSRLLVGAGTELVVLGPGALPE